MSDKKPRIKATEILEKMDEKQKLEARIKKLKKQQKEAASELIRTEGSISFYEKAANEELKAQDKNRISELEEKKASLSQGLSEMKKTLIELETELREYRNFDKLRCFENIRELLKNSNVKIGEIETKAGCQPGYMSRLEKEDNFSDPTVEFIVTAAKMLGVSVDYLISPRTNDASENEALLIRFLNKLAEDTESSELEWLVETPDELERMNGINFETGEGEHPLFREVQKPKPWESEYPEWEGAYLSYFGDQTRSKFKGDCYHAQISITGTELYLMNIETYEIIELKDGTTYDTEIDCFEVCLYKDGVEPLCRTDLASDELDDVVRKLYYTIRREMDSNKMSKRAKSIIETYLGDNLPF